MWKRSPSFSRFPPWFSRRCDRFNDLSRCAINKAFWRVGFLDEPTFLMAPPPPPPPPLSRDTSYTRPFQRTNPPQIHPLVLITRVHDYAWPMVKGRCCVWFPPCYEVVDLVQSTLLTTLDTDNVIMILGIYNFLNYFNLLLDFYSS